MAHHFNQLHPAEAERLAILAEECGEVIQAVGKILRHGYDRKHPEGPDFGNSNRDCLQREVADVLGEGSYEQFRDDHDAAVLFDRAAHHLMEVMQAFERRVRSECTPEQIEKRPWECAEYVRAATFLRRVWKDAPVTGAFVGSAWLIELDDPLGNVQYYCGPGDWCNNPNHAKKFPSEQAARESRDWYEMLSPQNMRIAEHIWGNNAND